MKLRSFILTGIAGIALSMTAQTHQQGIEYYKADQLNNALELLERNLNNPGTDKALSYYYLGQIEMRRGNVTKATNYFNNGIQADAECPYNYIGLGYVALKNGDVKTAEKYFKDAESRGKKDQSVQVDIARAYYDADKVANKEKYEKRIANAMKKDDKNPDIYIFEGDVLRDQAYAMGDSKLYGQAAAKYDMATSNDPTSAVAYVKYADMYTNAHNPSYAIQKLEELIRNNPQSALGQRQLAEAYYETGQYKDAARQYGNYVNNPNHFKEDEDRYSFILFYDGDYQGGYDYATKLLNENPDNFSAMRYQFMNAAQIESLQNRMLPMAEKLLSAHKANSDNKFAPIDYTLISEEFAKDGRPDDAIALLQEAMQTYPDNGNFNKSLASFYIDAEDYGKAADAYTGYIEKSKSPGYADYTQQALYAYFGGLQNKDDVKDNATGEVIRPKNPAAANKYFGMAKDYANKAIETAPDMYRPHKILGDVAKDSSDNQDEAGKAAVDEYLTAVELLEANPDPRYNNDAKNMYAYLAAYYYESGDNVKAKSYIGKALEIDPNNAVYKQISDSIK